VDLKLFRDGCVTVVQCKHWKTWKIGVTRRQDLIQALMAPSPDISTSLEAVTVLEGSPQLRAISRIDN